MHVRRRTAHRRRLGAGRLRVARLTVLNPADGEPVTRVAVASEARRGGRGQGRPRRRAGLGAAPPPAARARRCTPPRTRSRRPPTSSPRSCRPRWASRSAAPADSIGAGVGTLRQYAELGPVHRGRALAGDDDAIDLMAYGPRGVVAVITPWNDPVAVSCGLLGAALVTGNTVVYKPSERTPATGWRLAQLLAPHFPDGVLVAAQRRRLGRRRAGRGGGRRGRAGRLDRDRPVDRRGVRADRRQGAAGERRQRPADRRRRTSTRRGRRSRRRSARSPTPGRSASRWSGSTSTATVGRAVPRRAGRRGGPVGRRHRPAGRPAAARRGPRPGQRGGRGRARGCCAAASVPDGPGAYYPPTVLADCTDDMAVHARGDVRPGRAGGHRGLVRRGAGAGGGLAVRAGGDRADRLDEPRPAGLARAAGRHGQGQRGVRRRAGRCRASAPRQRPGLRVRPGAARRDDRRPRRYTSRRRRPAGSAGRPG